MSINIYNENISKSRYLIFFNSIHKNVDLHENFEKFMIKKFNLKTDNINILKQLKNLNNLNYMN